MLQVIDVHVPRTAGRTRKRWAQTHMASFQSLYRSRHVFDPSIRWTYFGHATLDELMKRWPELTMEWYDGCFKYAFVRNTWDRLASSFRFQRQRRSIRAGTDPFTPYVRDFETYVTSVITRSPRQKVDLRQLGWLKHGVDFIARFERLYEDWEEVCRRAGVPHVPLPVRRSKNEVPFQEYYTPSLRDAVGEFYADEIETFGFKFEE